LRKTGQCSLIELTEVSLLRIQETASLARCGRFIDLLPFAFVFLRLVRTSFGMVGDFLSLLLGGLLLLSSSFGLAEHISEAVLTHTMPVRNLTFSFAQVTRSFEEVILDHGLLILLGIGMVELGKGTFSENEVTLVWVVFDWSSEDHVALLELVNIRAFH
jgi:hypothetical protein